ncbi:FAD-binding and (Fe-S)-binding domain-containing protein [Quadrisphaera oryzae]|uniref:FAD-binding and (Fe-S)-binding domain-containing protein n=1 Tax=Quadrisphaera TaxID=317661 RepID=UPI0016495828|nr:FAD-binding and (Fe-S)-binding domain-containing protein [Quadrisphaera sp. RL12-1S]MBC3760620.1 FAD-binding oxidoreductase [Quadrisphaera sp. RL12-1S]
MSPTRPSVASPALPTTPLEALPPSQAEVWADGVTASRRELDRRARAHDASHYLLLPQVVATARDAAGVAAAMARASELGLPVTFRSGGTSLSGQALSDGLLLDVRAGFRGVEVGAGGLTVRAQPGATVREVNTRLARHARKLGPDPASEVACTVGGVVANNSSGMACGTTANTYRTLRSLVAVLTDGTVVDTGAPDADERLRTVRPDLHAGLLSLRERLLADPAAVAEVRRQFSMKNTMGYGLNALLDHETAVEVLAHLLVGSEGTLAFVAEATFETVPVHPHAATGLLVFPDLSAATAALPALVAAGAATAELLDAASLRVAQGLSDVPPAIAAITVEEHAALLVELQAATAGELAAARARTTPVLDALPLSAPAELTTDAGERAALWHVRKGLYTAVAGARPSGTTALLEDVVVPVEALLETCEGLTRLFEVHGYDSSVIFGHAKDGNIHFLVNERFEDPASLERYQRFTADLVDLVLGAGGSLKAEHGTGRIMAPFVRRQYGDFLHDLMLEVKRLFDPAGLLNPGVVVDADPGAWLRHLKTVPTVEEEVDRCVECGYCEPGCPSKDLTLTPRQRIVLRRELAAARAAGDDDLAARLTEDYEYAGVQTCAVDGLCAQACPVDINTGDLVRRLRAESAPAALDAGWDLAARHWGAATRVGGAALTAAGRLPVPLVRATTTAARAVLGADRVPSYSPELPAGGRPRPVLRPSGEPAAVLFASCTGTLFGPDGGPEGAAGGLGATAALVALAERAGVALVTPEGLGSLCCATPWKSKGLRAGQATMASRLVAALLEATRGGELPVVCDAASCTEGLQAAWAGARAGTEPTPPLTVVDATRFAADHLLGRLAVTRRLGSVVVHPTCSTEALGTTSALVEVAQAVADDVVVPPSWGCCAYAGDRGLLHPELTASATAREAADVAERTYDAYVSANRTCELGMTRATGRPYRHVLELLEAATR